MEKFGDRQGQMERYCSTGQSPQRAVTTTEEEEEEEEVSLLVKRNTVGWYVIAFNRLTTCQRFA